MLNKDTEAFKDFIKSAKLVDIFPKSGAFTWNNKRGGDKQIASRPDKFLVTETILLGGINVDSDILPSGGSDHWPIIMNEAIQGTPRNKPFRFGKFWLSHPEFTSRIEQWWSEPSAIDHRGANKILRIKDDQGTSVQTHHEISNLLINHFSQIAREPDIDKEEAIKDLLTSIPKLITEDQNKALNRAITMEEVEEAVKDMPNGKAPRPDGFTIDFYKACWEITKTEVWEVVDDSRCSSSILKSLNSMIITLIPKEEEVTLRRSFGQLHCAMFCTRLFLKS
eukprot:PITA_16855